MTGLEIWLLAIGLAMDCFAVSIASGIILKRIQWRPMLVMALAFGLFQALMPFIGWMFAKTFSHLIESVDHWIAFAILAFLGGRMILESFKNEDCRQTFNPTSPKVVFTMAIATSIDALAIGISFALLGINNYTEILSPILIIGFVSFVMSLIGLYFGIKCGCGCARKLKAELWGGIILVAIGLTSILTITSIGSSNKKTEKRMKTKKSFLWLAFLILATIWILARRNQKAEFNTASGFVFGTVYKIAYQHDADLKPEIEAELKRFDQSLSPFNDSSVISRVNRNEELVTDSFFQTCFNRSMEISRETKGAFDITIAPLANAWGFGFKKGAFPDSLMIDSLLQITGYEKVKLENGKVVKQDPRIMLSCSAVAKGYSVDVIARLLDRKGIKNYMVDIGGEVVVKGKNATGDLWRIGINKPYDDSLAVKQDIQVVLNLTDLGMATSGNYRNYYYKDGKKYAHTIDPRTGYPVQHSILSSTVIAEDCMTADALATSFMVMGLEEAEKFCKANPMIDAYFIYSGENGEFKTYYTDGMKRYMPDAK